MRIDNVISNNNRYISSYQYKHKKNGKLEQANIHNAISFKSEISQFANYKLDSLTKFPKLYLASIYKKGIISNEQLLGIIEKFADRIDKSDIDYFGQHRIPVTKYDTPEIIENRLQALSAPIYDENSDEYLRNIDCIIDIESKILSKATNNRKMLLLFGLPATGKTEIINKIHLDSDYYVADVDYIKNYFPSFIMSGKRLNNFQNLSQRILLQKILPRAINDGKNVIIPTTGYIKTVYEHAIPAKSKGYSIDVTYLKSTAEHSIKSMIKRYNNGGIYVDPFFVLSRSKKLQNFENELKECKYIDNISIIDKT